MKQQISGMDGMPGTGIQCRELLMNYVNDGSNLPERSDDVQHLVAHRKKGGGAAAVA